MIININTDRQHLHTWKEARAWCHVWWLTAIGGLDIGTLDRSEIARLARRFKVRLLQTLDRSELMVYVSQDGARRFRYPFRTTPYDEHYKAIDAVREMVEAFLRSPEKFTSWTEFAYGVHNTLMDGVMSVPPCQQYPGMPKEAT